MRLTFTSFNPMHETKDRVHQFLSKSTAKTYEKEYSRIGELLHTENICEDPMVHTLAERAYGVNKGEQVFNAMTPGQVNLCRMAYVGWL